MTVSRVVSEEVVSPSSPGGGDSSINFGRQAGAGVGGDFGGEAELRRELLALEAKVGLLHRCSLVTFYLSERFIMVGVGKYNSISHHIFRDCIHPVQICKKTNKKRLKRKKCNMVSSYVV